VGTWETNISGEEGCVLIEVLRLVTRGSFGVGGELNKAAFDDLVVRALDEKEPVLSDEVSG